MYKHAHIPHSARLQLTGQCNLECRFCLMDASFNAPVGELNSKEWGNFFLRLKELRIFNVILTGGEIFLRKDLFLLLEKLRENRMHKITLFTNGTLITSDIAARLAQLKIKNISLSIDGMQTEHDEIRGKDTFNKATNGIRHLINAGIGPHIAFTPTRSTYHSLAPFIDFMAELGIERIQVNSLSPEGRCLNIYKEVALTFPEQIGDVLNIIDLKRQEYPTLKIDCDLGFYFNLPESYSYFRKKPETYQVRHLMEGCSAASTSFTVTPRGNVVPCEGLVDFVGGNIREMDILDIWDTSENFQKIRNLAGISLDSSPYCGKCKYIYICNGGCRASAYLLYGNLLAPSASCPFHEENRSLKNE